MFFRRIAIAGGRSEKEKVKHAMVFLRISGRIPPESRARENFNKAHDHKGRCILRIRAGFKNTYILAGKFNLLEM